MRIIAAFLIALTCGCAAIQTDPVGTIERVVAIATTAVEAAQILFGQFKMHLPISDQAAAQAKFDAALTTVLDTKTAIEAAVKLAADAGKTPDLVQLTTDLSSEIDAVRAVIADVERRSMPAMRLSETGAPPHAQLALDNAAALLATYARPAR